LVVRVDDDVLDETTIDNVAEYVSHLIHSKPIAEDVNRYLALIRAGMSPSPRRLATVRKQLDVTWDLYEVPSERLVRMLPKDFDRFKPSGELAAQ
jgi:hypothetical protein